MISLKGYYFFVKKIMLFLEQIKKQFILTLCSYDGPSENVWGGVTEDENTQVTTIDTQLSPEDQERLKQIEEQLDQLDAVIQVWGQQLQAYVAWLKRILADNPNEAQEEPKEMAILRANIERLTTTLEQAQSNAGQMREILLQTVKGDAEVIQEGINTLQGEEADEIDEKSLDEVERLTIQRDSLMWIIRESLADIDTKSEDFSKYSQETQNIILLALELSSRDREFTTDRIDRVTWEIVEVQNNENLVWDIIQLEDTFRDLSIALYNESINWEETTLEQAENRIERDFLDLKENGSEIVKEIIGDKEFLDMRKWDFMRLWLEWEVDLWELFLTSKVEWIGDSWVGDTFTINFAWNPEVGKLLSSIIPLSAEQIVVDWRTATRTWERDFILEWWLPVSIQDGSEIIIQQNNIEITPEQVETRIDSYRESMASNTNREEFERRVNNQILQNDITGEGHDDNWLATIIKKVLNAMAQAMWEDPIFEEVLKREEETLYNYSDADSDRIREQGMRRFSPDGQEVLRDTEFMNNLSDMCDRLWVQKDDMLIVMQAESRLDPTAINDRSGASWLIQFMPSTAEGLDTSIQAIRNMTAVEQLVYVEKYFENYAGRMNSVADIYRVVFYPASIGKPADWVMWSQNGTAARVARDNWPGITQHSRRPDGLIDNATFDRYVAAKISQFSTFWATESSDISIEWVWNLSEERRKVVQKALDSERSGNILGAIHCTDWVDRIYKSETGRSVYDAPKLFDGWVSTVPSTWGRDTGLRVREYAWNDIISQVQAWDHIMVDHGPWFGRWRTHSVIALESPQDGILQVVSYPNWGRPPVVELYDLTGQGRSWARPEKAMRIHTPA